MVFALYFNALLNAPFVFSGKLLINVISLVRFFILKPIYAEASNRFLIRTLGRNGESPHGLSPWPWPACFFRSTFSKLLSSVLIRSGRCQTHRARSIHQNRFDQGLAEIGLAGRLLPCRPKLRSPHPCQAA